MRLAFIGCTGAGKGTQSAKLVERYGFLHLSTGDLLRSEIEARSEIGRVAAERLAQGQLVPDDMIIEAVRHRLAMPDGANGYILDGFPRTAPQAEALDRILAADNSPLDRVLSLEVDESELLERLLKRGRNDDKLETIRERFRIFKELTEPMLEYYDRLVSRLVRIDGSGEPDEIFQRIIKALGLPE